MEGLRQRKKTRTRDAIIAAAMRLFDQRGFDGTRVEEIVEAAEVSRSTFFRYFERKEDLVFVYHEARVAQFRRLTQGHRAPGPSVFEDTRQALLRAVDAVVEEFRSDPERLRLPRRLVNETPALAARASQAAQDWELAIAAALRSRMGDENRLRADLMAAAMAGPVRSAMRAWEESDYTIDPTRLAAEGLDLVGRGLADA